MYSDIGWKTRVKTNHDGSRYIAEAIRRALMLGSQIGDLEGGVEY